LNRRLFKSFKNMSDFRKFWVLRMNFTKSMLPALNLRTGRESNLKSLFLCLFKLRFF